MRIENDPKLDFKDVLIRPKRSTLGSRSDVDINRSFHFLHCGQDWMGFPLIAANMDVTGTIPMAKALKGFGAMVALHKHYPIDKLIAFFNSDDSANTFYTLGIAESDHDKFKAVKAKAKIGKICIDVANGYTEAFLKTIERTRKENPDAVIMAGNVVTGDMTEALILAGADIVKVGIGPGSVCTTRKMTGVGYPQLSAIIECADAAHGLKGWVCGDGGLTVPGDVAKAYGAGGDFVMMGGMLSGHDECEGDIIHEVRNGQEVPVRMVFYGMSSDTAMKKYAGGVAKYRASEGKTVEVPYRGPVSGTMQEIMGGVRSMMTYIGAVKLKEVSKRTTFVRVGAQLNTVFGAG
jgi:GMP reductase